MILEINRFAVEKNALMNEVIKATSLKQRETFPFKKHSSGEKGLTINMYILWRM